MSHCQVHRQWL